MWFLSILLTGVKIGFDPVEYSVSETGVSTVLTVKVLEGILGRNVDMVLNTRDGSAIGKLVTVQSAQRILIYSTALSSSWTGLHCYIWDGPYLHFDCS